MSEYVDIYEFDQRDGSGHGHTGWAVHGEDYVKFFQTYCDPRCGTNDEMLEVFQSGEDILIRGYDETGRRVESEIIDVSIHKIIEFVKENKSDFAGCSGYYIKCIFNLIIENFS